MQEEEKHWRIDYWGVPSKQNIGCIIYTTNGILKGADDEHIIVFNRETAELIVKAVNDYSVLENIKKDGGEAYMNGFNDGALQMQAETEHLKKLCADQYDEIKELKKELQHVRGLKIKRS